MNKQDYKIALNARFGKHADKLHHYDMTAAYQSIRIEPEQIDLPLSIVDEARNRQQAYAWHRRARAAEMTAARAALPCQRSPDCKRVGDAAKADCPECQPTARAKAATKRSR